MTHSAPAVAVSNTHRRLLSATLGALLLLGLTARPPVTHASAAVLANDGAKIGTGGG